MTRIKTKFKPREVSYTGRKIRIVPSSPFLQLSRVHEVGEVQAAIPRVIPPPLYRKAVVPLPLAVQQQMQRAKLVNNSLLNKPDVPESAASEEAEERAPVLFLENGKVTVRVNTAVDKTRTLASELGHRCSCCRSALTTCPAALGCLSVSRHHQSLPGGPHLPAAAAALHRLAGCGLPGRRLRASRTGGLLWHSWGGGDGTHRYATVLALAGW